MIFFNERANSALLIISVKSILPTKRGKNVKAKETTVIIAKTKPEV